MRHTLLVLTCIALSNACWATEPANGVASGTVEPITREEESLRMNPANAALRFALELGALGAMGWWGHDTGDGASSYTLMVGVPVAAAATWGIFAVPGDPSRGGSGVIPVSGATRLVIEAAFLGLGAWALHDLDEDGWAIALGSATIVHYAISWDRVRWLLRQ